MDIFFTYLYFITLVLLLLISFKIFDLDLISPSIVTLSLCTISAASFLYNINDWTVVFTIKGYSLFVISFIIMILTEYFVKKNRVKLKIKRPKEKIEINSNTVMYIVHPLDKILFAIFFILSVLCIYRIYQSGVALGAVGLFSAIGYNKEFGEYDYVTKITFNIVKTASFIYIVLITNNVINCQHKLTKYWKEIIIVIESLILTFVTGQRSMFICHIIAIFVASCIANFHSSPTDYNKLFFKYKNKLSSLIVGMIFIFFVSANAVKANDKAYIFLDYMTYYFGSTIALMSRIVENPDICHSPFIGYFGEKTFNWFYRALYTVGIVNELPCDKVYISMGGQEAYIAGNEFTFFCAPYIDFGYIGTLLFIFLFYLFFNTIYYWKILNKSFSNNKFLLISIYIWLYTLISMTFYQDTIRVYSSPMSFLYISYMFIFYKLFVRIKR